MKTPEPTAPAHTDAVEIAKSYYAFVLKSFGNEDSAERQINALTALIEPKLRQRDERIIRLTKLFDQERLDNIEMRQLLAEIRDHHAEGLRHVENQEKEITELRAKLAAAREDGERWRYYADCPQTALMLGSRHDPNDKTINWVDECRKLCDAARQTHNEEREG